MVISPILLCVPATYINVFCSHKNSVLFRQLFTCTLLSFPQSVVYTNKNMDTIKQSYATKNIHFQYRIQQHHIKKSNSRTIIPTHYHRQHVTIIQYT